MKAPIFRTALLAALLTLGMSVVGRTAPADDVDALLHSAVNGAWRSPANKARDQYRHPVETLEFFGLKPDMTVVELAPGGGWYTEILAPVLRDHGHLIEAGGRTTGPFADLLKNNAATFGKVTVIPFSPPDQVSMGADNSADLVLTFRNTHDWLNDSEASLAAVFAAAYKVLKPGGVFGVVEHRARPYMDAQTASKTLHRVPEDYLIALGLKTGFQLGGVSEINANPKDDESLNVHQLLPNLAGSDESLKPIGESDRMTLKFVKPSH